VDGLIKDTWIPLTMAPRLDDVWPGPSDVGHGQDAYQVALDGPHRWAIDAALRFPPTRERVDRTVQQVTGNALSPNDVHDFERRALDAATEADYRQLKDLSGPPYNISPSQKQSLDGIAGRLGTDPQAQRFRHAYEGAIRAGQIRVR
jgi:hypothetical protein